MIQRRRREVQRGSKHEEEHGREVRRPSLFVGDSRHGVLLLVVVNVVIAIGVVVMQYPA